MVPDVPALRHQHLFDEERLTVSTPLSRQKGRGLGRGRREGCRLPTDPHPLTPNPCGSPQPAPQRCGIHRAGLPRHFLAIPEHHQGRNAANAERAPMSWALSVFSLANRAAGSVSAATCLKAGAIDWQGPHHGAQQLTTTGSRIARHVGRNCRPSALRYAPGTAPPDNAGTSADPASVPSVSDDPVATLADDLGGRGAALAVVMAIPSAVGLDRLDGVGRAGSKRTRRPWALHRGPSLHISRATTAGGNAVHAIQGLLRGHGCAARRNPG